MPKKGVGVEWSSELEDCAHWLIRVPSEVLISAEALQHFTDIVAGELMELQMAEIPQWIESYLERVDLTGKHNG